MEYLGIPFLAVLWLILVIHFTGNGHRLTKRTLAALLLVPVCVIIMHYTNDWHHLYYTSLDISFQNGLAVVSTGKGPAYALHIAYAYFCMLTGMILFARMYWKASSIIRKQVVLLASGCAIPWLLNIAFLAGSFGTSLDLEPFGFTLSGLIYMWGIYRFNMLRLTPLALEQVFESMRDGVVVFDAQNGVVNFNRAAAAFLRDADVSLAAGKTADEIFARHTELLQVVTTEQNREIQIPMKTGDARKYYSARCTAIRDHEHSVIGRVLILGDVTEEVDSRLQLQHNARKLAELNALKDRLFAVVAHDIRDPLAVLVNMIDILEEELKEVGEEAGEAIREIGMRTRNTFMLVEELLDWFRGHMGETSYLPGTWNVRSMVERVLQWMTAGIEAKKIRIDMDIAEDMRIHSEKTVIESVFRNLLSNAVKFSNPGGSIRIEARREADRMILSVRDHGVGIPAEKAAELFSYDPSSAGTPGTAGEKGLGLGLSLCRQILRHYGGDLWLESREGRGSVFYMSVAAAG